MSSGLYIELLGAVSPFELGVADLKVRMLRSVDGQPVRPKRTAAVLVPVIDRIGGPEILLTVRSKRLEQHPGQVSFPGGSVDRNDRSAVSTALREAEEEIGLDFSQVSPLGFLDRLDTNSDFRVLPVVGLVKPDFISRPNFDEVAEVFTIPFELATDYKAYSHEMVQRNGQSFELSSLQWQEHRIWGVTAAILLNLGKRMYRANAALREQHLS
jgi:8-oxo-dGTP pyrophosphatase MutT (NUDIX family)